MIWKVAMEKMGKMQGIYLVEFGHTEPHNGK